MGSPEEEDLHECNLLGEVLGNTGRGVGKGGGGGSQEERGLGKVRVTKTGGQFTQEPWGQCRSLLASSGQESWCVEDPVPATNWLRVVLWGECKPWALRLSGHTQGKWEQSSEQVHVLGAEKHQGHMCGTQ